MLERMCGKEEAVFSGRDVVWCMTLLYVVGLVLKS